VPGYLSTVVGVPPSELSRTSTRRVLVPSLLFVGSFSTIFIIVFGLGGTALGSAITHHLDVLEKVAGAIVVALGAFFILTTWFVRLNREWHVDALMRRAGRGGPFVAGAAFAVAWTPCIGPTLGAITTLAAASGSEARGAMLLAFYSAGLAIPFILTALFFGYMTSAFELVKRHYRVVILLGGILLVAMGILMITGEFTRLNQSLSGVSFIDC
jgi:cytochrome c-type biogenesis protein